MCVCVCVCVCEALLLFPGGETPPAMAVKQGSSDLQAVLSSERECHHLSRCLGLHCILGNGVFNKLQLISFNSGEAQKSDGSTS